MRFWYTVTGSAGYWETGWAFGDSPEQAALAAIEWAGKYGRGKVRGNAQVVLKPEDGERRLCYCFLAEPNAARAAEPELTYEEQNARGQALPMCTVVGIGPAYSDNGRRDMKDDITGLRATIHDLDHGWERRILLDDGRELFVNAGRLKPVVLTFAP